MHFGNKTRRKLWSLSSSNSITKKETEKPKFLGKTKRRNERKWTGRRQGTRPTEMQPNPSLNFHTTSKEGKKCTRKNEREKLTDAPPENWPPIGASAAGAGEASNAEWVTKSMERCKETAIVYVIAFRSGRKALTLPFSKKFSFVKKNKKKDKLHFSIIVQIHFDTHDTLNFTPLAL